MTQPSTSLAITSEIQKLAPSAVIELFVLDLSLFGQGPVRFHAGTNALMQRVVWQGNAYEAFPIQVEGFELNGGGQVPRPRLRVANVTGSITALVLSYQDLIGAKITRKRRSEPERRPIRRVRGRHLLRRPKVARNPGCRRIRVGCLIRSGRRFPAASADRPERLPLEISRQ